MSVFGPRSRARDTLALAFAAMALAATSPASAAGPGKGKGKDNEARAAADLPADVETAEDLYAQLDYEHANETAKRALAKGKLGHDEVVRGYRVLAITYAIMGDAERSADAFFELLVRDPAYKVDSNLGPKVAEPFREARGRLGSLLSPPGLELTPSVTISGGTLKVTTRNPTHIAKRVVVGYRWSSSGAYVTSDVPADGQRTVEIPAAPAGRSRLDYYAQAFDERDSTVFETGSPRVPKSAFLDASRAGPHHGAHAEQGKSFVGSPAFWIVAGAAVLGGAAAVYFVARPSDPPTSAALLPVPICGTERCN